MRSSRATTRAIPLVSHSGGLVEQLVRIPSVGEKTTERMILELRDKLGPVTTAAQAGAPKSVFTSVDEDVISALRNFGATGPPAEAAVPKARSTPSNHPGESNEFDALFRRALKLVR